ncbi:MAG: site-specific integrase [Desulfomonilaceae bacterium]
MGQKVPPGLRKRGETWYIWKTIGNHRIRESTGTSNLAEAERYLAHRMEQVRNAEVYGVRPKRTFREAATKYLNEADKATLNQDVRHLKQLDPFIGDLPLEAVHMGTLQPFIDARKRAVKGKKEGKQKAIKIRTINYALQVVRHILNLAAGEWMDEYGLTWLRHAPKIKLLRETDKRPPYPLSWDEQERLFAALLPHLRNMALFSVNTGCRDHEVCELRWNWEIPVPPLETSVFVIPGAYVKNREDRLVVLNSIARGVIEQQGDRHPVYVFLNSKGSLVRNMCREAWRTARKKAGLLDVRVHDLMHTFGTRLRHAGVSFEDRQDLLGHKSGRITITIPPPS